MFLDTFISEENDGVLYLFQKKPPNTKQNKTKKKQIEKNFYFFMQIKLYLSKAKNYP